MITFLCLIGLSIEGAYSQDTSTVFNAVSYETKSFQDFDDCINKWNANHCLDPTDFTTGVCCHNQDGIDPFRQTCLQGTKQFLYCTNRVEDESLKTFTSPNPAPCPATKQFIAESRVFRGQIEEHWAFGQEQDLRTCSFRVTAEPSLNAKIRVILNFRNL